MAASLTPKPANKHSVWSGVLAPNFAPGLPLAVALSGSADSTALLLACHERWPHQVRAIHIHHGLQEAADSFASHCETLCAHLQVPLVVSHVNAHAQPGQSPEEAARSARYQALASVIKNNPSLEGVRDIALGQHADDQIETLILALSRGAGLPGMASMPAQWAREGLQWHRPFLQVPGAQLRALLVQQGQTWAEDPSNQNEHFTRNRIRARVMPALEAAFPQFRETFARSASHAAQAQDALNELATMDLQTMGLPPSIKALQSLSPARQALVLRHWLRQVHQTTPSAAQMQALQSQLQACSTRGHQVHLKVGAGFVKRVGPALTWQPDS